MYLDVHGYTLEAELYQGKTSRVYRARRDQDNCPVILKAHQNEFPSGQEVERYEREYLIGSQLNLKHGARVLELLRSGYRMVIVYQDDDHVSLRRLYSGKGLDVRGVLTIGLGIAEAVAELHEQQFMHNNLSPSNILVHPKSGEISLTNFGLAYSLNSDTDNPLRQAIGALAYTAPEKTGRTSQRADFRSDLYAIGIILFEIATGRHPFAGLDDAALSHAHIALMPPSMLEFNQRIPEILETLILKLMAKDLSDRYQTARGLLKDLQHLIQQWDTHSRLEDIPLGQNDHVIEFLKTEKLYGREDNLRELDLAYTKALSRPCPVWVSIKGPAGCGKSALVNAFAACLPGEQIICTGHGEPLEQDSPFAALSPALSSLLRHWLTLPEEKIAVLRTQLQNTLSVNSAVLAPLIPELYQLLGALPELLPLDTATEQTRFLLTLTAFVQLAAEFQEPLVLFIDDIQWADLATLALLEQLLISNVQPFLLITAGLDDHKDTEISTWHLRQSIAGIQQDHVTLKLLSLCPRSAK